MCKTWYGIIFQTCQLIIDEFLDTNLENSFLVVFIQMFALFIVLIQKTEL